MVCVFLSGDLFSHLWVNMICLAIGPWRPSVPPELILYTGDAGPSAL